MEGEKHNDAIGLARTLLELDDREFTASTLAAYVLATAAMGEVSPRSLLSRLMDTCPDDEDWFDVYLPDLVQE